MDQPQSKLPLYNPLDEDFVDSLLDDNNQPVQYIIPTHDIKYFEPAVYHILEKHLMTAIINDREINTIIDAHLLKAIEKEIHAELD